ncbi:acetylcholinesterase-like [Babylonia areolata]|uniref:acetylcholinesterase-like n=1 Tax=Babylonia areolata TaxID=304850 RepID=UPI003FD0D7DD
MARTHSSSRHSSSSSSSSSSRTLCLMKLSCPRVAAAWLMVMMWTSPWMVTTVVGRRFMERQTMYGRVRGLVETVEGGKRVEKYLGIPYARPPLGELRFEAPQPPAPWKGVLRATELPPACPQPQMGMTYIDMHIPGFNRTSEDCLYLNIHSPKHGQNRRLRYPVVVFVHGGSYQNGMGAMLDGDMLASYDVIVVTFNYRLGALGFLSIPGSPLGGNYGMLDQVEALKWVKANIASFGGDPNRVTIDGHSAGGCSVGLLMLSPLSKGLFTGVIEQSGSPFAHWAVNRHQSSPSLYVRMFVTAMGCSGNLTSSLLKGCLQQLPSDIVQEIILNEPEIPISLIPAFRPVVDGHFLPELPEVLATKGDVTGHHFLTGATLDEGLIAAIPLVKRYKLEGLEGTQKLLALMNCFRGDLPQVHGIVESILEAYAKWPYSMNDEEIKQHFSEIVGDYFILAPTHKAASVMAALNLTVFVYNYEYRSDFDQWEGVMHGAELFYLSGFPLKGHTNFRYDDSDKHMARLLLQLWANFAKNGLPSLVPMQNFHMPRFTLGRRAYTRLFAWDRSPSLAVQHDLKPDKLTFWNRHVPLMFQRQLHELLKYPPAGTLIARPRQRPGSTQGGDGDGDGGGRGREGKGVDKFADR